MASLIKERRRARLCAAELLQLRAALQQQGGYGGYQYGGGGGGGETRLAATESEGSLEPSGMRELLEHLDQVGERAHPGRQALLAPPLPAIGKGGWQGGASKASVLKTASMQPRLSQSHSQPAGIVRVEHTRTGLQRRVGMDAGVIRPVKNSSPKIRFPAP